ncbi:MAG: MFS transporter [Dehalococcoidia bacterium]|nr:MFS transporter [Dehalococcoidia bacterium]
MAQNIQRQGEGSSASAPAERELTRGQRQTLLITAVAGHGIKHLMNAAFPVLLPEMKTALGFSNTQIGILSSARFFAGGLANFPAGYIADTFTKLRAIVLGLSIAGIGIAYFLAGITTSFWLITIITSLMVVSISLWHPAAIGSLSRNFTSRRGFAISLHGTGGSVGEAAGPIVAGVLLGFFTWQFIFQGAIVPALILGFVIWFVLRRVPADISQATSFGDYAVGLRTLLSNRRLLLVLLFTGGFAGAQATMYTFLPIYLREDVSLSPGTVGLYLSLLNLPGLASQPAMGYLSDRWGRKAVLTPAMASLGVFYLVLGVVPGTSNLLLGFEVPGGIELVATILAAGLFFYPMMAIFLASASDLAPADVQSTTVSLVFGVATLVGFLGPLAAGVIADTYSLQATFYFCATLVLTAAFVSAVTRWEGQRQYAASD